MKIVYREYNLMRYVNNSVRLFGKEMGLLFGIQGKLVNYQVQLLAAFFRYSHLPGSENSIYRKLEVVGPNYLWKVAFFKGMY